MNTPTKEPIMVDLAALYAECQDVNDRLTLLRLAKLHFINTEEFALACRMREIEKGVLRFIEDYRTFAKDAMKEKKTAAQV